MKIVTFFNNKGGVGKTSLVYHVAWMYADQGYRVVAADLDPQANLTAMFLDEDMLEKAWNEPDQPTTIFRAIQPLLLRAGDVVAPVPCKIADGLSLVLGDIALSTCEDAFSEQWTKCIVRDMRAFSVISAFYRVFRQVAESMQADVVLIDVGPNLGAINRAALIAADHVVVPVGADLIALHGLMNLGRALRMWKRGWMARLNEVRSISDLGTSLPEGSMQAAGYIAIMQHATLSGRACKSHDRWMNRIPDIYRDYVLNTLEAAPSSVEQDPECLAILKDYRSLRPMAQEARKPMFHLTPADGALGAHTYAVKDCYKDFAALANALAKRCQISKENDHEPG